MMRFIFESDIASWSTPDVLVARLDRWVRAGFDTVMLQVEDGHGATWGTDAWVMDPRVIPDALKVAVETIHGRGLSVIVCVSVAVFNDSFSPYPELKLSAFSSPFYNFWHADFRERRLKMIVDLANACDCDGVALDYLRTGREALGDEGAAAPMLQAWLGRVRAAMSPGIPLLGVHHSSYASSVREGVNLAGWSHERLIAGSVLFNYETVFPAQHALSLMSSALMRVWPLIGNYDWTDNHAVPRTGRELAGVWRRVRREVSPDGIGVYLANLLTDEQVTAIRNTQRMVAGL